MIITFVIKNELYHLERQQIPMPPSQNQLDCGGRACPTCGKCRDWYGSRPQKRNNGTCHAFRMDILTALTLFASGITTDSRPINHMCKCANNR